MEKVKQKTSLNKSLFANNRVIMLLLNAWKYPQELAFEFVTCVQFKCRLIMTVINFAYKKYRDMECLNILNSNGLS